MIKLGIVLLSTVLAFSAYASFESYYPADLESSIHNGTSRNSNLKEKLSAITKKGHHAMTYKEARRVLFGKIDLKKNNQGYYLLDVYCHEEFSGPDVGPNLIPDSTQVNCEHTWPQSKFSGNESSFKVSDLHHLFVTGSKVNSVRGNNNLGNVNGRPPVSGCNIASIGKSSGGIIFTPPEEQRGDSARAMFYFATRYNMSIDEKQEKDLREWNKADPVDEDEKKRNDEIEKIQGNRNPFVDFPEAIDQISNF